MNNNNIEKLIIERLNQINYGFPNIWGVMIGC